MIPITTASDEVCKGFLVDSRHFGGEDPCSVQNITSVDQQLHEPILVHIPWLLPAMLILVCGLRPELDSCVMRGFSRGMRLVFNPQRCLSKDLLPMAIRIKARGSESVEQMLRRFKKLCEKEGLTKEVKKRQYYEKPSERRRRDDRKSAARVARVDT